MKPARLAQKKIMKPQITQISTDFFSSTNRSNPLNPWLHKDEV